jgi:4-hydroxy-tetrahydrodipicolinate reductase
MIKLAVSGSQGRMGQRITQLALEDKEFKLSALLEYKEHPKVNTKVNNITVSGDANAIKGSNVLIEFTLPDATMENLKIAVKHKVPMVIGTTGLTSKQIAAIKTASKKIPIVFSSNMSVGVNIVFKLVEIAAGKTGKAYSINIIEGHHIHKKDAPSGTAKTLAEYAEKFSKQKVQDIKSIREGEIIGDHDVIFESEQDIITIRHHAKNRDIFAKGSLVAAKFLKNKKAGLYNMQDVLGFNK